MSDETPERKYPSVQDYYVKTALYERFYYSRGALPYVRNLLRPDNVTIDCYCDECGSDSVFQSEPVDRTFAAHWQNSTFPKPSVHTAIFHCTRNPEHVLFFSTLVDSKSFMKVGQYPSLADLAEHDLKQYRKILGPEQYGEFARGVGLFAHGVGIGAFVYLRRIFERLMETTFQEAKAAGEVTDEQYRPVRMEDKIALLKNHLPEFVVQNKRFYGIVSKGVHELTEEECLDYFPTVRTAIEVILDQRMEVERRKAKTAEASKAINLLNQKIRTRQQQKE